MSQTDPYSPPKASLDGLTPSEQHDRDSGVPHYSTFWQRVGATLIDWLILCMVLVPEYFFGGQSRMYYLYAAIPSEALGAFLYLFMVVKYGATPGKVLVGLRIANLDGSGPSLKVASLRYAVSWIFSLSLTLLQIVGALRMTDGAYRALGYMDRSDALDQQVPFLETMSWLWIAWLVACLVTMLANPQRRTLHDFIAGTVVLRR